VRFSLTTILFPKIDNPSVIQKYKMMRFLSQSKLESLPTAICLAILLMITSCSSLPIDQVDLMPAPDVYGEGLLNPLPEINPFPNIPYKGILYATDRRPAGKGDLERYYANERGLFLRLGVARVALGNHNFNWDFARNMSMLKTRTDKLPIRIDSIILHAICRC